MSPRQNDLGTAEFEVLKALWQLGPATVRDVLSALEGAGRHIAYTTVQTMLTRLEQKNFVRSDKSGPAFVYRAVVSRERLSRSRLKKLVDQLYDGAAGPLVLELVRTQHLDPAEIEELQKLIERLDQKRP
jgi:BlaI family transcriptional regulator, penicillinase repressor